MDMRTLDIELITYEGIFAQKMVVNYGPEKSRKRKFQSLQEDPAAAYKVSSTTTTVSLQTKLQY